MKKIVINSDFGGFSLSDKAMERYLELKDIKWVKEETEYGSTLYFHHGYIKDDEDEDKWHISEYNFERDDPALVQVVEELGVDANGTYANLKIVEIPDDIEWHIHEYDGIESVHEKHRVWS